MTVASGNPGPTKSHVFIAIVQDIYQLLRLCTVSSNDQIHLQITKSEDKGNIVVSWKGDLKGRCILLHMRLHM